MKQAKVIGRVFCSRQCCGMNQRTMLLIEPLDWENDKVSGEPLVAADCVGAGAGETVFYVSSREAIMAFKSLDENSLIKKDAPPIDAAILGIIDGKHIPEDKK